MPLDLRALAQIRSSAVLKSIEQLADRCVQGPLEQAYHIPVAPLTSGQLNNSSSAHAAEKQIVESRLTLPC